MNEDDKLIQKNNEEYIKLIKNLHEWLVLEGEGGCALSVKPDAPEKIKNNPNTYISIYNRYVLFNSNY